MTHAADIMTRPRRAMQWLRQGKRFECALVGLLVLFALGRGMVVLSDWRGPGGSLTTELYIPAICFAQNRGFINAAVDDVPGMRSFLDFQAPSLAPHSCAAAKPIAWEAHQKYHRYLIWYIGAFWKLFGVSWEAMKLPIVLLFLCFILLNYALFRLAMPPLVSFFFTILVCFSPAACATLPVVRDFGKGPFFLAVLTPLAWLLVKPRTGRSLLGAAAVLGVAAGIGIGFRRDLGVSLPIVALILLGCRCAAARYALPMRFAACGVFAALFLVFSWPIVRSFQEEGSLGAHDAIMGFDPRCESAMSLYKSSYERMTLGNDMYIGAIVSGFEQIDRKVFGSDTVNANSDKEGYLKNVAAALPADMLTRVYASILAILKGGCRDSAEHTPSGLFFAYAGPLLAVAAVAIVAAYDLRTALLAAALLLYFCGYTSLQMHPRHVFHLAFVPFWLLGFSMGHAFGFLRSQDGVSLEPGWGRRVALAGILLAAGFLPPLGVARTMQARTMDDCWRRWTTEPAVPVACERRTLGEWTLFDLRDTSVTRPCASPQQTWNFFTEYYAATFTATGDDLFFWLKYEAESPADDFSHLLCFPAKQITPGARVRCFFPVFHWFLSDHFIRFVGVAVPTDREASFAGVSRLDAREFPLLLSAAVPENRNEFLERQRLGFFGFPEIPRVPEPFQNPAWFLEQREACLAKDLPRLDRAALIDPPNLLLTECRATVEASHGSQDDAIAIRADAVRRNPGDPVAQWLLDRALQARNAPDRRAGLWQSLAEDNACACAEYYLGQARRDLDAKEEALAALWKAWERHPNDGDVGEALASLLIALGRFEEARPVCLDALLTAPESVPLLIAKARIEAGLGRIEDAVAAAKAVILRFPEAVEPYAAMDEILRDAAPETALSVWREVAGELPESPFAAMRLGNACMAKNDYAAAVAPFAIAVRYHPGDPAAQASLGEALVKSGHPQESLEPLRKAIALNPKAEYVYLLLATALHDLGQRDEALKTLRELEANGGNVPQGFREWIDKTAEK